MTWPEYNYNLNISLVRQYLYVETAKVACSTIKKRLSTDAVGALSVQDNLVHTGVLNSPFVKPFQVSNSMMRRILDSDAYFRFTFVREPVERIVSAYLDKITRETPQRTRFFTTFAPDYLDGREMSLQEFVDTLAGIPNTRLYDKHWRPQSDLIFGGSIQYNLIGCFARLEEDWKRVAEAIGLDVDEQPVDVRWHQTGAKGRVDEIMTPQIRQSLERLYSQDFEIYEQVLSKGNVSWSELVASSR